MSLCPDPLHFPEMETFVSARTVRLRSCYNKYLVADDDGEHVRQDRNGSSRSARWAVELVDRSPSVLRLKSCYGRYLTASAEPFLLGTTGRKVLQTLPRRPDDPSVEWVPARDGPRVQLATRQRGNLLRANGGLPPWRNSITHDGPHGAAQDWVLWDVEIVKLRTRRSDRKKKKKKKKRVMPSPSVDGSSPTSTLTPRLSVHEEMELFKPARVVRLKSHHDKYLVADADKEHVRQDHRSNASSSLWTVELPDTDADTDTPTTATPFLRLKSCHGLYLTASSEPLLLGVGGRKVIQSLPRRLDSSVEWEPVRDGFQVRLRTRYGQFLRANVGLPPWRNSVTHDVPHRSSTQDWVLWDVQLVHRRTEGPAPSLPMLPPPPASSPRTSRDDESSSSFSGSPPKSDGRTIFYAIAEADGTVDNSVERSFSFKGTSVSELTEKLEEETELSGIVVCSRNPLNGQLCPLRLHLPPNNSTMHVVVLQASSKHQSAC